MKKLSVIRGHGISCPYGLSVIDACKNIGEMISQLQPLDSVEGENKEKTIEKNKFLYSTQKTGKRCLYANVILEKFNTVDCSYGDTAAGEQTGYLPASPLYQRTFIGYGLDGDDRQQNITDPRLTFEGPDKGLDVPFGMFSIFSSKENEAELIRIASKTANKIVNIRDSIALLRNRYFDTLKLIIPNNHIVKLNDVQLEELLLVIDDWAK